MAAKAMANRSGSNLTYATIIQAVVLDKELHVKPFVCPPLFRDEVPVHGEEAKATSRKGGNGQEPT